MNAEIITIGTELLLGDIVDTNATHIARRLRTVGMNLYYKTTVGDNNARCAEVISNALNRADVIITTGGLGPTVDDITREAVALATNRPLEFSQALLEQIEARFSRWGSTMTENNRRQAFIPQAAIPMTNPVGSAPCFIVETDRGVVISLPGVPREMEYLLEHEVLPFLTQRFGLCSVIKTLVLRTAAMGESRIDSALSDLLIGTNPTVGLAAHPGQTDVRITAKAENAEQADRLIAPVEAEVRRRLGSAVYGTGKEKVEEVLLRRLAAAGLILGTAEAGTGGLLTSRLSNASRPGDSFGGGFVAIDPPALGRTLEITLDGESEDQLVEFARRVAERLAMPTDNLTTSARLGLVALTMSRPSADAATSASGTVIALATPEGVELRRLGYGGHSANIAAWSSTNALEMTRLWLESRYLAS